MVYSRESSGELPWMDLPGEEEEKTGRKGRVLPLCLPRVLLLSSRAAHMWQYRVGRGNVATVKCTVERTVESMGTDGI